MDNETKLALEIWECVRDIVPAAKREDTAEQVIRLFQEYGFDINFADLEGEDSYLDKVIELFKEDEDGELDFEE